MVQTLALLVSVMLAVITVTAGALADRAGRRADRLAPLSADEAAGDVHLRLNPRWVGWLAVPLGAVLIVAPYSVGADQAARGRPGIGIALASIGTLCLAVMLAGYGRFARSLTLTPEGVDARSVLGTRIRIRYSSIGGCPRRDRRGGTPGSGLILRDHAGRKLLVVSGLMPHWRELPDLLQSRGADAAAASRVTV